MVFIKMKTTTLPTKIIQTKRFNLSFIAAACLLANVSSYASGRSTYAGRNAYSGRGNNSNLLPYMPRVFLDGALAPQGFLYGDAMVPVIGNTEGFAFIDGTGKGGTDHGWLGALGGGLREIWRGAIFGGYLFGEYDRTALGNNTWTLNPGLEMLSPHWDVRINGYFPLENREYVNNVYFGSQLGVSCPVFKGRQQFDQVYNDINEIAPGLDAQVGYIIPNLRRTRVFGGGYYYFFNQAPEIRGLVTGVELPLNQTLSLMFRDSYDNVNKNTAVFTLRVYFGGINKVDENDVHERLLAPMERHIGVLYTGSGIPTEQVIYDTGELKLMRDNIWFFQSGGSNFSPTACTYENPCNSGQFNQNNINAVNSIASNASFYLANGVNYFTGPLTLNPGQSIYGRTADFCQVAPGSPVIYGSLMLSGYNNLQGFRLINQPDNTQTVSFATTNNQVVGIAANNAPGLTIDHVTVGSGGFIDVTENADAGNFRTGVLVANSVLTITNSTVNAADTGRPSANAVGIFTYKTDLKSQNTKVNVLAHSGGGTFTENALGFYLGASKATINNAQINVFDTRVGYITFTDGIDVVNGDLTLQDSIIKMRGFRSAAGVYPAKAYLGLAGVYATNSNGVFINNQISIQGDLATTNSGFAYLSPIGFSVSSENTTNTITMKDNSVTINNTARQTTGPAGVPVPRGAGLYVYATGPNSNALVNSSGDNFSITTNAENQIANGYAIANDTLGIAIRTRNFANVTVNTNNDLILIHANGFAPRGISSATQNAGFGIQTNTGSIATINSTHDTVQVNANAVGNAPSPKGYNPASVNNGGAIIFAFTNSHANMNINGDSFNLEANCSGATLPRTVLRGVLAYAGTGGLSTINVKGDSIFHLDGLLQNAHPGAIITNSRAISLTGGIANVITDGSSRYFIV